MVGTHGTRCGWVTELSRVQRGGPWIVFRIWGFILRTKESHSWVLNECMGGDGEEVVTQCLTLFLGYFPRWLKPTLNPHLRKCPLIHLTLNNSNESAVAMTMLCKEQTPNLSGYRTKRSYFLLLFASVSWWRQLCFRLWTGLRSCLLVSHSEIHAAAWILLYPY